MCKDCGCEQVNEKRNHLLFSQNPSQHIQQHAHPHTHEHDPLHEHEHNHPYEPHHLMQHSAPRRIELKQNILQKNEDIALQNRRWFDDHHIRVLNLMSSPGSGKTALLEKTLPLITSKYRTTVLVGDQQTNYDALRLAEKGAAVKQINTYTSCHLDASMIARELGSFVKEETQLLFIENIGNLVCPAAFHLGEHHKVAIFSVTEGEDKPAKYPVLFHDADVVVLTKCDLIPHLDWNQKKFESALFALNPDILIIPLSAKTGEGLDAWIHYLEHLLEPLCA